MKFLFEAIVPWGFLEACRSLDHVQKRATSHLLESRDAEMLIKLMDYFSDKAEAVTVTAWGGYGGPGQKYFSVCSQLRVHRDAAGAVIATAARVRAPETPFYRGPRYTIHLRRPKFNYIQWPRRFVWFVRDYGADPDGETWVSRSLETI